MSVIVSTESYNDRLREIQALKADAATVVRALDAAIIFCELLVASFRANAPLDPRIGGAKANLDQAMAAMRRPAPVESEALKIAAANIAQLTEHRARLGACLNKGLVLIDAIINELQQLPNLPIAVVVARNQFHDAMQKLMTAGI